MRYHNFPREATPLNRTALWGDTMHTYPIVKVKFVDPLNVDGKTFEGKIKYCEAVSNACLCQVVGNMTKTASIVGMKCIERAELFETITVVG